MSSIGTVKSLNPIISELLYHTTSLFINVPVRMPFTIKKGTRIIINEMKYLFSILDLSRVARSKAINNIVKLNKVYALSKFKTMITRIKTIRIDVSILTTVSLRIISG